jgi:ABC-type lipoprotein export system ATPase subunit
MIDIKIYEKKIILSNAKIIILKGESGSGKSTLLKSLKEYYGSNSILIDDKSFIFEGTIEENILVGREKNGCISRYLEILFENDARLKNKKTKISSEELSTGQIQRISLLRDLIISNDKIVLLDEPTSALDTTSEERVCHLISNNFEEMGIKKLILSTHSNELEKKLKVSEVVYLSD